MIKPITVTQPCLPPLEEFIPYLQQIWENKWLTNNGPLHQQLEKELADYLWRKIYFVIFKWHISLNYCSTSIKHYR